MKFCPECGIKLTAGTAKFCTNCGMNLGDTPIDDASIIQSKELEDENEVIRKEEEDEEEPENVSEDEEEEVSEAPDLREILYL